MEAQTKTTLNKVPVRWTYKVPISIVLSTDELAGYFARLLRKGKDFGCTVYGDKRMGKSISTAELIRKIALINNVPFFSAEHPEVIENNIVFYKKEFYKAIRNNQPYSAIMLDDFGSELDARRSMEKSAINISHHFHTSGTMKIGYFITTPTSGWVNKDTRERVANYYIWLTSKNEDKGFVNARVFYLQKNEVKKKIYQHNLFLSPNGYINNRGVGWGIKSWVLYPLPKDLEAIYTPYRLEKAEKNLQKGIDELDEEEYKDSKFASSQDIFKKILLDKAKYQRKLKTKDEIRWDKGLIAADYNLNNTKLGQVISLLRRETGVD